jgi:hypothetical protein
MKSKLYILFLLFPLISYTQQDKDYSFESKNVKLRKVLLDIENTYQVKFSFLDKIVEGETVTIKKNMYPLDALLKILSDNTRLVFERIDKRYYAIYRRKEDNIYLVDNEVLDNVVIKAYLTKGIDKNIDNSFTIIPQRLGILPGLTEPDVLQTLQQLPGVISPNETVSGIHVRGGTPDQNLVIWNDIQMYHNGHLFGMISGFNSNIDQEIRFYNKGTDPKYGGKISSVISINTSDKIPKQVEVSAGLNFLNLDVNISAPIIKDKLKLQISGRRSFTDLFESITYDRLSEKVFQNTKIENKTNNDNIFYFRDYNAKLFYQINKKNSITISSIYIDNKLDNFFVSIEDNHSINDLLLTSNEGYSFKWNTKWNHHFSNSFKAFYSYYLYNYKNIKISFDNNKDYFIKNNTILDSGFSYDSDYIINQNIRLNLGYDFLAQDVSHSFLSENDDISFVLDSKKAFIQTHSIYSSLKYQSDNKLDLMGGFRVSYFTSLNKFSLEPRFVLNYKINDQLKINVSGEIKDQVITQIKETIVNDLGLENQLWTLSDIKKHPILKAKQFTTGITFVKDHWLFDIDTYIKETKGLTTLTFGFLNNTDPDFHDGKSKSYGVDFYLKRNFKKFKTWMSYSFNTTNNTFKGLNDSKAFPVNSEIKHAINLALSYRINELQFALGWYWHTGKPFTNIKNAKNASSSLIYDQLNAERLPYYHRLDISSLYHFDLSKKNRLKGKFGISLYNVYNQKNLLNREYYKLTELDEEIKKRDRYSLLFTPNIFLRINF